MNCPTASPTASSAPVRITPHGGRFPAAKRGERLCSSRVLPASPPTSSKHISSHLTAQDRQVLDFRRREPPGHRQAARPAVCGTPTVRAHLSAGAHSPPRAQASERIGGCLTRCPVATVGGLHGGSDTLIYGVGDGRGAAARTARPIPEAAGDTRRAVRRSHARVYRARRGSAHAPPTRGELDRHARLQQEPSLLAELPR